MYIGFYINITDFNGFSVSANRRGVTLPQDYYGNTSAANVGTLILTHKNSNKTNANNWMINCSLKHDGNNIAIQSAELKDLFGYNKDAQQNLAHLRALLSMEDNFKDTHLYGFITKLIFNANSKPIIDQEIFLTHIEWPNLWHMLHIDPRFLATSEWFNEAVPFVFFCFNNKSQIQSMSIEDIISSMIRGMLKFTHHCSVGADEGPTPDATEKNLVLFEFVCLLYSRSKKIEDSSSSQVQSNTNKLRTQGLYNFYLALANLLDVSKDQLSPTSQKYWKNIKAELNIKPEPISYDKAVEQARIAQQNHKMNIVSNEKDTFLQATPEERKVGMTLVEKIITGGGIAGLGTAAAIAMKGQKDNKKQKTNTPPQSRNKQQKNQQGARQTRWKRQGF
jgi:hypothetical protein